MKLVMVKDGNSIDITDRVTAIDISNATDNGSRLLGNAICSMLELELNNFDGSLKGCASCTFLYGPDETAAKEFNVQEAPSKYTGRLKLTLYDDMIKLNKAYGSTLTYSTTSNPTIAQQIAEISTISGIPIDSSTLMASVTSMSAAWIDTTIIMRNYIGWIAELSGKNCYINDSNVLTFENLASVDHAVNVASNFDISDDTITISRVAYDDGVTLLQKGDDTGKTLYIDANNSYCTQQSIIDAIYDIYNGLSFHALDNLKTIGLSNLRIGHTVTYDSLKCIALSIKQSFQGTNSLFTISGEVDIKNTDSVISKENTEIRIKRVQTKVDQEAQRLDIVVTDVKNQDSVIDTLTLQVGEISTEVASKTEKSESIKSVTVMYLQNTGATPSKNDTSWSTTKPASITGQTMWSMQVYTMADGTTVTKADPVNITTLKGDKGDTGVGISSMASKYQGSADGTTPPTGTWLDTPPLVTDDAPFLWTKVTVTYTDNTTSVYYQVTKKGDTGAQGDAGKSIRSFTTEYYLSTSEIEVTGGSWESSFPIKTESTYIWYRNIITYTDNTTATSAPVLDGQANKFYTISNTNTSNITQLNDRITNEVTSITTVTTQLSDKQAATDENISNLQKNTSDSLNSLSSAQAETANDLASYKNTVTSTYYTKSEIDQQADSVNVKIQKAVEEAQNKTITTLTETVVDARGFTVNTENAETHTTIDGAGVSVKDKSDVDFAVFKPGGSFVDILKVTSSFSTGAHNTQAYKDYEFEETTMADATTTINGTADFWIDDVQ
jgi:hypothetical protein